MSLIITDGVNYDNIASAIRSKTGGSVLYKPSEMAAAITAIPAGNPNIATLSVSMNGMYTPTGGIDGYGPVIVSVPVGTNVADTTASVTDVRASKIFHLADGTPATGTLVYNWMGENPEYVKELYTYSATLSDTNYVSWTPSTTASSIKASSTLSTKETIDLATYDYVVYWISDANIAYDSSYTTLKGRCLREICMYTQSVFRRPASTTSATSGTEDYNAVQQDQYAIYWCKYYSSETAISLAYTTYSPCYISSVTAFAFASTANETTTLTIKTPVLSTRCSSTYFTTGAAAKVDQTNSTVKLKGYLYRVKAGTCGARQTWRILTNIWQHPL